jgi:hypothetical protein
MNGGKERDGNGRGKVWEGGSEGNRWELEGRGGISVNIFRDIY